MIALHLVARAYLGLTPLTDARTCVALWRRLSKEFKKTWGAVFMPNHLHLIIPAEDRRDAVFRLGVCLRATSQALGRGDTWASTPPAEEIATPDKLLRQIRYVHLNPCRKGLTRDPSLWRWNTHRDLVGAAFPRWLDTAGIAAAIRMPESRITPFLQKYITSGPSVSIGGLEMPCAGTISETHPAKLQRALLFALRPHSDWRSSRRLSALLSLSAGRSGRVDLRSMAAILKTPRPTLYSAFRRAQPLPPDLRKAVELCLRLDE